MKAAFPSGKGPFPRPGGLARHLQRRPLNTAAPSRDARDLLPTPAFTRGSPSPPQHHHRGLSAGATWDLLTWYTRIHHLTQGASQDWDLPDLVHTRDPCLTQVQARKCLSLNAAQPINTFKEGTMKFMRRLQFLGTGITRGASHHWPHPVLAPPIPCLHRPSANST